MSNQGVWATVDTTIGLTGPVLHLSNITSGSLTSAANQTSIFNAAGILGLQGHSGVSLVHGTSTKLATLSTGVEVADKLSFPFGITTPLIEQGIQVSDTTTHALTIRAQDAYGSATGSNRNGGTLRLQSGAHTGASAGQNGIVDIYSGATGVCYFKAFNTDARNMVFYPGTVDTTISLDDQASDIPTRALTLQGMNAFASATGGNKVGGNLNLFSGYKASGGSVGFVNIGSSGASDYVMKVGFPGAETSFGSIAFLPIGTAPSGTNYHVTGNTSDIYLNAPSATGSLHLAAGGADVVAITYDGTVSLPEAVSPVIYQTTRSSDASTHDMKIHAQIANASATGANRNGGHLLLQGGSKATGGVDGSAKLMDGNSNVIVEAAGGNKLAFYAGTPVVKQTVTGTLSAVTDANAKAVLTSIIAALAAAGVNLVADGTG